MEKLRTHGWKESRPRCTERCSLRGSSGIGRAHMENWRACARMALRRFHRGRLTWRLAHKNRFGWSQLERWNRVNLEMVVAVPWREQWRGWQDGAPYERSDDGQGYKEKLEMKEHVRIPKRVYISRENFKEFEFTARGPGRTPMLKGTAGHAHMEALSKTNGGGIERHFQGAQRCVKEYQECAAKRRPATSSSSCSAAPSSSTNKGSEAARMDKRTNIERFPSVCRWRVDDSLKKKQKEDGGKRGRKDRDEDRHMSQDVRETEGRR